MIAIIAHREFHLNDMHSDEDFCYIDPGVYEAIAAAINGNFTTWEFKDGSPTSTPVEPAPVRMERVQITAGPRKLDHEWTVINDEPRKRK